MSKVISIREDKSGNRSLWMMCPGCNMPHSISEGLWDWNKDEECPTISPSILVTQQFRHPVLKDLRCHSFIREGQWEFLGDCSHDLAGRTVPMMPIGEDTFGEG